MAYSMVSHVHFILHLCSSSITLLYLWGQCLCLRLAFSNGKVPSNQQIDVALNSFLNASFVKNPSKNLSLEGQRLVSDSRDVVEQAKILLLTKNEGNILQDFIWQTQQLDTADASLPETPVDKEAAKQHGNQVLEGLRTLGMLIITNGMDTQVIVSETSDVLTLHMLGQFRKLRQCYVTHSFIAS